MTAFKYLVVCRFHQGLGNLLLASSAPFFMNYLKASAIVVIVCCILYRCFFYLFQEYPLHSLEIFSLIHGCWFIFWEECWFFKKTCCFLETKQVCLSFYTLNLIWQYQEKIVLWHPVGQFLWMLYLPTILLSDQQLLSMEMKRNVSEIKTVLLQMKFIFPVNIREPVYKLKVCGNPTFVLTKGLHHIDS